MPTNFKPEHRPGLFRLPLWLNAWKQAWGQVAGVIYLGDEDCPPYRQFYQFTEKKLHILPLTTLVPIGLNSAAIHSIRGEYFCCENGHQFEKLLAEAKGCQWDQFYLSDVILNSREHKALQEFCEEHNYNLLIRDYELSYGVDLSQTNFDSYLKGLGKNTRLKFYNRRTKLQSQGKLIVKNIWPDIDGFIQIINGFHQKRWGKLCFSPNNEQLMRLATQQMSLAGHGVDLSVMYFNDQPVSTMLDLEVNGRVYNIQSGYLEDFMSGVSLGTLHFGFQIEAAFNNPQVNYYDFMAGRGKNANYKASMANARLPFISLLIIRNPIIRWLYKINDLIKGNPADLSGYMANYQRAENTANPDRQ